MYLRKVSPFSLLRNLQAMAVGQSIERLVAAVADSDLDLPVAAEHVNRCQTAYW